MLDIVWFMPIMFPVQVTYTTSVTSLSTFVLPFYFFKGKGFFFWFIYATFRTVVI